MFAFIGTAMAFLRGGSILSYLVIGGSVLLGIVAIAGGLVHHGRMLERGICQADKLKSQLAATQIDLSATKNQLEDQIRVTAEIEKQRDDNAEQMRLIAKGGSCKPTPEFLDRMRHIR
jgi:hypothetical protein